MENVYKFSTTIGGEEWVSRWINVTAAGWMTMNRPLSIRIHLLDNVYLDLSGYTIPIALSSVYR